MSTNASPMQYLEKAMNSLHDMGLVPDEGSDQEAPIIALLNQISDLDETRVAAIARTLDKASLFNDVVREQVQAMEIGERYEEINSAFNSIRDDAKTMVEQIEDGKLDTFERISNVWMKVTRGDIASRFEKIKGNPAAGYADLRAEQAALVTEFMAGDTLHVFGKEDRPSAPGLHRRRRTGRDRMG